jgi:nucleoside-triphosphatase THEP1
MIVVTGEIGAGKTTWCADLIAHVRALGLHAAGVSSPGVFADGEKIAIDLLDLAGDEQRRLADRLLTPDSTSPTPRWKFHPETLAWGDDILSAIDACDLLVIDELGPLELRHSQGWVSALPLLRQGHYRAACVVVRRALLETFLALFPDAVVVEIDHNDTRQTSQRA